MEIWFKEIIQKYNDIYSATFVKILIYKTIKLIKWQSYV